MSTESSEELLLEPVGTKTLTERVIQRLSEAILRGRLKPGTRLKESKLARELRLSRVPVREAIQRLEEQGLVTIVPRRGAFVVSLSDEDIQKINSLRLVLESEALMLCKAQLTPAGESQLASLVYQWEEQIGHIVPSEAAALDLSIHRTMWTLSGNEYLVKLLTSLAVPLFAHRVISKLNVEKQQWGRNSHIPFLEYVRGSSSLTAEEVVLNHLRFGWQCPERFSHLGFRSDGLSGVPRGSLKVECGG